MPASVWEYVAGFLLPGDELLSTLTESDAWEEVPCELRNAILLVALLDKTTGRFPELASVGRIAAEYADRSDWVLMAFGWFPPLTVILSEMDRTVLRLATAIDRSNRTMH